MLKYGRGVCYSGYRENQSPLKGIYPTYEQVLEDLRLLIPHYDYLRMYDISQHAQTVLSVIENEHLPLKVMLGVEPRGEISNPNCPWGGLHSETEISANQVSNLEQLDRMAKLANDHHGIVLALSVGNECTSDWHPNLMSPETMADRVRRLKAQTDIPVTFCEGGYFWRIKGDPIAREVDFISIHCYPLWMKKSLSEAVEYTIEDFRETQTKYPGKSVIFTEYGWTTRTNGSMDPVQVGESQQAEYMKKMEEWGKETQTLLFAFEAFDEPWKGGNDPSEPEKHWGLFGEDRKPKQFMSLKK